MSVVDELHKLYDELEEKGHALLAKIEGNNQLLDAAQEAKRDLAGLAEHGRQQATAVLGQVEDGVKADVAEAEDDAAKVVGDVASAAPSAPSTTAASPASGTPGTGSSK